MAVDIYGILADYPTLKNEFLNTLVNKVVKSQFYDKVFNNPLSMLHKGLLEFGTSVEELFVEMAETKGFNEHFSNASGTANSTDEQDLIAATKNSIKKMYLSQNFMYKYKVSISDDRLRGAFTNSAGLFNLTQRILSSMPSKAYLDEYNDMLKIMQAGAQLKQIGMDSTKGTLTIEGDIISSTATAGQTMYYKFVDMTDVKNLAEGIRSLSGRLKFPSTLYNQAKVNTWSDKEDLVLLTTPELVAKMDVQVLSQAFNVSSTDIKTRTIEVDSLPTQIAWGASAITKATAIDGVKAVGASAIGLQNAKVLGILCDKDYIQYYDTLITARQFDNGNSLVTNHFMHKRGIAAQCYFANAIVLIEQPTS